MAKLLKSGELSEYQIHKTVMEWVRKKPGLERFVLHMPNEGRRTKSEGFFLKQLGMRKGASDLFIALPRHGKHGAWIELKTTKGKLSFEQGAFLNDMMAQGYYTKATYGLDEALEVIEWYITGTVS